MGLVIVDSEPDRALVVATAGEGVRPYTLDDALAGWLDENGYHADRRKSRRTGWEYHADVLGAHGYRLACQREGLDLDCADTQRLRDIAQAWAKTPKTHKGVALPISKATHNRRLASVSSFYHYAQAQHTPLAKQDGAPLVSPVMFVKREKTQRYEGAQPLDRDDVLARLEAIDDTTLLGKRDYALLQVALNTGRRLAELQALTWGDVQLRQGAKVAHLTWPHAKGGKRMYDTLDPDVTRALLTWLHAAYGARIGSLPTTAPIWVALPYGRLGAPGEERAISHDAIRDVYVKRLHTGKVHASRHTFSEGMLKSGASVLDLQGRLGHASLDATASYARAVTAADNPFAGKLAAYFGADKRTRRAPTTRPLAPGAKDGRA